MTYEQAARILASHGIQHRASQAHGCIQALSVWTHNGETFTDWENIKLDRTEIRNWLGY